MPLRSITRLSGSGPGPGYRDNLKAAFQTGPRDLAEAPGDSAPAGAATEDNLKASKFEGEVRTSPLPCRLGPLGGSRQRQSELKGRGARGGAVEGSDFRRAGTRAAAAVTLAGRTGTGI
jgi:hypothetical protein